MTERVVERTVALDVPVEVVWRALTDAAELTRWFPLEARVTPGAGGSIWMRWDDVYDEVSPIEIWEPGRRLRLGFPNDAPVRLATDYYLEGDGGGTILRVVTSGFGTGSDWDEWYDGVTTGWAFELRSLKHYLERHRGVDRAAVYLRLPCRGDAAAGWHRVIGERGWFRLEAPAGLPAEARCATASGHVLTGAIEQWRPGRQAVMTVREWNDALFRVERDRNAVIVWMSVWGLPAADVRALEQEWRCHLMALDL
jgi:uncharacterized protein YndB with AHSA1/START domain